LFNFGLERGYALFQRRKLAANFINFALQLVIVLHERFAELVELILKFLSLFHGVSQVTLGIFGRFLCVHDVTFELRILRFKSWTCIGC
jgi:hypothetical protein